MSVSTDQIESWTNPGAVQSAINSHTSIRSAIAELEFPGRNSPDVFLQGSYKNHTNIRGDSDVDVVIFWPSVFWSNLSETDKLRLGILPADYSWQTYDKTIQEGLTRHYGNDRVHIGKKAITISFSSGGYVPADVVNAFGYRLYDANDQFEEGITFFNRANGQMIVNYPKQHFDRGNRKSEETSGNYRKVVRAAKHARNFSIDHFLLAESEAPSYYLESLVYALPNSVFGGDIRDALRSLAAFALHPSPKLLCQNGMTHLFGENETSWSIASAARLGQSLGEIL